MTAGVLDALPAIALDELAERAGLQTRVDRKYLVPLGALDALLADLAGGAARGVRVLEIDGVRDFSYESVYFDSPDLVSYLGAAHRRRRRFKVRTRTYVDQASCWVEVKTRGPRGATVKSRLPYALEDRSRLTAPGLRFTAEALDEADVRVAQPGLPALAPTLVSAYHRTTLHLPGGPGRPDSRTTVDTGLTWTGVGPARWTSHPLALRGLAVVETKTGSTPSATDRLLWRHGHRPVRLSKYGTGMAALAPDLPATPWRRVLDRWVLDHAVPRAVPDPLTHAPRHTAA